MRLRAEGVLETRFDPGLDATEADAEAAFQLGVELHGGVPRPSIVVLDTVVGADADARQLFQSDPRMQETTACVALVVGNHVARVIGKVILTLNQPAIPVRLFSTFDEALDWAKEQRLDRVA